MSAAHEIQRIERTLAEAPLEQSVIPELVERVRTLVSADATVAYRIDDYGDRRVLAFCHNSGLGPRFNRDMSAFAEDAPRRFTLYTARPSPTDRNRFRLPIRDLDHESFWRIPIATAIFKPWALVGSDQPRMLVCNGADLVAWIGSFREDPFTDEEMRLCRQLEGAIARRAVLEHTLLGARVGSAALSLALDSIAAPAFVIGPRGVVVHENALGKAARERDRRGVQEELARSATGAGPYRLVAVDGTGLPRHHLAVRRPAGDPVAARLPAIALRFGLSPRQAQVLGELVRGASNATIAERLSCSTKTVEVHVTSVLKKLDAKTRAHAAARFFSEEI